ncbi:MAG: hypothetical protein LV481_14280 [Methylacidiphilales bacterium]|nr:hypothetical protein [Candidatus Methylacidiphilales bacterium]
MILHVGSTHDNQPKISSNQLGEYIFATPSRKIQILQNHKFGSKFCAPYYTPALEGIIRSFQNGRFSRDILTDTIHTIESQKPHKPYHIAKKKNNVQALKSFLEIGDDANPPLGDHKIISRNARVVIDGVAVSARPEIITEVKQEGLAAFTKLRISKSRASADAQEIVLLVLLHYGQQQSHDELVFSLEKTKLIDCFSKTIIAGHTIGRHRDHQLHKALAEIRTLWPTIKPRDESR